MPQVTLYHNSSCSKSRRTLELLEERGLELEVIDYLQAPPSPEELDRISRMLGLQPLALIRTKEPRFAELGLSASDERPREEWLRLMSANPVLIQRPLVLHGDRAALGRPPEDVLAIL